MPRSRDFVYRAIRDWKIRKALQIEQLNHPRHDGSLVATVPVEEIESRQLRVRWAVKGRDGDVPLFEREGPRPLRLHGLTVVAKDNFTTHNLPTTCASSILQGFTASPARALMLLEKAGMKVIAKSNMDEFGMGSHTTHSSFGPASNGPFSAGGSSGGSALAVAHNLVDCALGSDTGGSVRLPAAYTNVIGFKPSYGIISRNGLIPYANSLDTVGILAQTCDMIEDVYEVINGPDGDDPTCISRASRLRIKESLRRRALKKMGRVFPNDGSGDVVYRYDQTNPLKRYRIGIPAEYSIQELHPLVRKAWMHVLGELANKGHVLVPISLPTTEQALSAYYVLAPAEASSNLAKYDGVRYGAARNPDAADDAGGVLYAQHRSALFGSEVKRRILLGTFSLSAGAMDNYFIQAQKVRRLVQNDFNMVFRLGHPLQDSESIKDGVDFIVCPTAPTPPPFLTEVANLDPVETYTNDVFTVPASLAGLPAISVPAQSPDGPRTPGSAIGMQVIGQYGDDLEVIRFARRNLERMLDRERLPRPSLHRKRIR